MEDMEKFKEEVSKLNRLVIEGEQGLSCWWSFLDERMTNLFEMYYGVDPNLINMSELRRRTVASKRKKYRG